MTDPSDLKKDSLTLPTGQTSRLDPAQLRQYAEETVSHSELLESKTLSAEESRQMLHELHVHQIELEMQNEELRRAQVELDASRARYFDLYDLAPVGYCTISEKGLILEANLTAANLLGVSRNELVKQSFTRFILKADEDIFYLHRKKLFEAAEPQVCELRMLKKDATSFWTSLEATLAYDSDGAPVCGVVMIDITMRKQAEEVQDNAIRALKELDILQAVMNGSKNSHLVYLDREFNFVRVNEAYAQTCGYRPEQMIGKNHFALYPHAENEAIFARVRDTGEPIAYHDKPFEFPDQPERGVTYWDWTLTPVKAPSGQVTGLVFSLFETTRRKRTEQALLESEERYRALVENSPDLITRFDRDLRMIYVNPPVLRRIGKTMDELIGRTAQEYGASSVSAKLWEETARRVLETGQPQRFENKSVWQGQVRIYDIMLTPEYGTDGAVASIMNVARDITEREQAELLGKSLNNINYLIHSRLDQKEILDKVMSEAAVAIGCETAGLSLRIGDHWIVSHIYGLPSEILDARMDDNQEPHAALAIKTMQPVAIEDAFNDSRVNRDHVMKWNIRSVLVTPIISEGGAIGIMFFNYHSRPVTFHHSQVDFISKLASSLSLALTNVNLINKLQEELIERKRAEEAFRASQALLHEVMTNTSDPIYVKDAQSRILMCNPALEKVVGKPAEEIIGKTDSEYYEDSAIGLALRENDLLVMKSGRSQTIEETVKTADGNRIFLSSKAPYRNESGDVIGIIGISHDITERKLAEEALFESEKHYRSLFDNMLDGFAYCRMLFEGGRPIDFIYLNVNKSFERLTGLKDVMGKKVSAVIPGILESDPEIFEIYGRVAMTGRPEQFERYLKSLEMWFSVSVYSYEKEHFIAVFDVITERKRAEKALKMAYEEMEIRVEERTADLKKMNEALIQSNMALEDFAHVASHDLQEPLRKIMTFSERLTHADLSSLNEQNRDYLSRMQQAAARMQLLILDLVKYSRVMSSPGQFKAFNLKRPVEEAIMDLAVLLEENEGRVEIDDLPNVKANETQMRQLFQNLIGNALKYRGSQKPMIRIYRVGSSEGGLNEIHVEDNGIGFDEQHLDQIFKPFQRLHGKSSPIQGTGMGLAICRKIVEFHGGSITAKSEPGKGSTFIVRLPKPASPEGQGPRVKAQG